MITTLRTGGEGYTENNEGVYKEYVCDSASDVANLPDGKGGEGPDRPRPGSIALVVGQDLTVYMLSNQRTWVAVGG